MSKVESAKATVNERNSTHNFDALKAEIEVLKKLIEQNAFVANQLSHHNNNPNKYYKRYSNNNNNNQYNEEKTFTDKNNFKNNKFNRNNYYQPNTNFPTGQHFNIKNFTNNHKKKYKCNQSKVYKVVEFM